MSEYKITDEFLKAREDFIGRVKKELLGPGSEYEFPDAANELVSSNPLSRYSVGILFPQQTLREEWKEEDVTDENVDDDEAMRDDESLNGIANTNDSSAMREKRPLTFTDVQEPDEISEDNLDEEINMASQYMPSSMGLTFFVRGDVSSVKGSISYGTYRRAIYTDCVMKYNAEGSALPPVPEQLDEILFYDEEEKFFALRKPLKDSEAVDLYRMGEYPASDYPHLKDVLAKLASFCVRGYKRIPHSYEFTLDFSQSDFIDTGLELESGGKTTALRHYISDDIWSITIMFINTNQYKQKSLSDHIFQATLEVSTENCPYSFVAQDATAMLSKGRFESMDDEEKSLAMLYRDKLKYATGLGVSVGWQVNPQGAGRIWTDYFPEAEVPSLTFDLPDNAFIKREDLSMKRLSDIGGSDRSSHIAVLTGLVNLYRNWVEKLRNDLAQMDPIWRDTGMKNLIACEDTYRRMYEGIETLKKNDKAYDAFILANRAMFMQRVHLRLQKKTSNCDRYPEDEEIASLLSHMDYHAEDDEGCIWRPFQVAFWLMTINSIVDEESDDRDLVDLIWFPTGGGKTEAYLALTAFTIFYRRFVYPANSSGTSVIMRYTLRLLTSQQFTRASTLICACERIRRDCNAKKCRYPVYNLGQEAITIGLWIGGQHTPNTNADAKKLVDKLSGVKREDHLHYIKDQNNKFQVLKCPWCGTKLVKDSVDKKLIGKWGYAMRDSKRFYLFCPQESCDFTHSLPLQVIDEELYKDPPTLLFGTVDKFAMLPWLGEVGRFFGKGSSSRPPELIIQDELHLISGALGTIVGLYEAAIDALCLMGGKTPKIVASTATIRRAKEQCSALYNRKVIQFPAPAIDADDSFFARVKEISYSQNSYGRKYIGIFPSGLAKIGCEVNLLSALLQLPFEMELTDRVKDKYWTVTTYFGSLRDLGHISTLINDEVRRRIRRIAFRKFRRSRPVFDADELTSRVTTTELNYTLDKLEKLEHSDENRQNKRYASDVLLATNMISVGIDIPRLNIMHIVGQPKLTSEYIQASSRVGRQYPGAIFVQFDASRSRDRSYYEDFRHFHDSFYRYVEPTGVTPFSKPARERALHAVVIAILRQQEDLLDDKDAENFGFEKYENSIKEIQKFVVSRVEGVNRRFNYDSEDQSEELSEEIRSIFEEWQRFVELAHNESVDTRKLFFGRRFMFKAPNKNEMRLLKMFGQPSTDYAFDTLTSMRTVDSQVKGMVIVGE